MDPKVAEKVEKFFAKYKPSSYKKGEIMIRAGDAPPGIFYLTEGFVKKYAISRKGDELVVNIFKPVSFFPMDWGINDNQNDYYYEAITALKVTRAPRNEVVDFIKSEPDVLFDLMKRVYRGADGLIMRMTYLMAGNAYARLVTELVIHAKRFGIKGKDNNSVEIEVSEKDLAARAGMTRETVSREMKTLKSKGLIEISRSTIVIKNLGKLEEELVGGV